jgi:hypothetical protein
MCMSVVSVLLAARVAVEEETKQTFKEFAIEADVVKVQRYHPSRQGIIVAVMVPVPIDPTTPVKRS